MDMAPTRMDMAPTRMPDLPGSDQQLEMDMAAVFDEVDNNWSLQPPGPPRMTRFRMPAPRKFSGETAPADSSIPFMFNFSQFDQKMIRAQEVGAQLPNTSNNCYTKRSSTPRLPRGNSDSGLLTMGLPPQKGLSSKGSVLDLSGLGQPPELPSTNIDPSAFCFNPREDGDLLHLVFGMAGEMPTMATTHLHSRPIPEDEEVADLADVNRPDLEANDQFLFSSHPGLVDGMDSVEPSCVQYLSSPLPTTADLDLVVKVHGEKMDERGK